MNRIQMKTPLVEMDGDEMTRVLWAWIKEELIEPFVELKTEYYDLGLKHRDETNDQVTVDSAQAARRLGVAVKCYLSDPRTAEMAAEKGITRTQAGIRLAVAEHPDALFVFGNAPTALMELCQQIRLGKAMPAGIVAAPVGFVHVRESKHMVKPFRQIPKLIVEGRKGGSNLAATLVNAILCYNDAANLKPGRDV